MSLDIKTAFGLGTAFKVHNNEIIGYFNEDSNDNRIFVIHDIFISVDSTGNVNIEYMMNDIRNQYSDDPVTQEELLLAIQKGDFELIEEPMSRVTVKCHTDDIEGEPGRDFVCGIYYQKGTELTESYLRTRINSPMYVDMRGDSHELVHSEYTILEVHDEGQLYQK